MSEATEFVHDLFIAQNFLEDFFSLLVDLYESQWNLQGFIIVIESLVIIF